MRLGLDLIVIIANDSAYGAEHIQFVDRKMDPSLTESLGHPSPKSPRHLAGKGLKRAQVNNLKPPCRLLETVLVHY